MDPNPDTAAAPADDGELLSAYLAGELDADAEAALEARLGDEPDLRAALERQREVVESLAALGSPAAPAGAGDRLRARLEAERSAGAPGIAPDEADPSTAADPGAAPADLDAARARRRPGGISWAAVGSVAAALVAVAVVGAAGLGGFGQRADTTDDTEVAEGGAARDFLDADSAEEAQLESGTMAADEAGDSGAPAMDRDAAADFDDADSDDAATTDGETLADAASPIEPVIAEDGVGLADADAVRAHLAGRPEAAGLLGQPVGDAEDIAAAFTVALRDAAPFSDGTRPDRCVDLLVEGAAGPVVPARVELVTYEGAPALAHLLVSSGDGEELDRIEAWIVGPGDCATRLFLVLSA